jgi:hypothetical protein
MWRPNEPGEENVSNRAEMAAKNPEDSHPSH